MNLVSKISVILYVPLEICNASKLRYAYYQEYNNYYTLDIAYAQMFVRLFQVFSKDITFSFNFSDYTIHYTKSEFLLTVYVVPTGADSLRQRGRD